MKLSEIELQSSTRNRSIVQVYLGSVNRLL